MKLKLTLVIIILLALSNQNTQAGVGDWTTFTSQNDIRDLILIGDYAWCASNGGVFSYQVSSDAYQQFNNTNGLTSVDARTIEIDHNGNTWVGFADGWINCYDPVSNTWKSIQDYLGRHIYDLEAIGDSILVALDIGISLYDIKRKEVKETYKHLGWQLQSEIDVNEIMVVGREIWAATESGIARSSFDLANLMAPESWTNYTTAHGLPNNEIHSFVSHNDTIYAATKTGVAVLRGQNWTTINSELENIDIVKLVSKNTDLFAVSPEQVYRWNQSENRWQTIGSKFPYMTCLKVADDGGLWVGTRKSSYGGGIGYLRLPDQSWESFIPPGPPGNEFNDLVVDQDGVLWCATPNDGIVRYDGTTWRQYTMKDGLIGNRIQSITVDSRNRKWFGSVGGGLIMIDTDETIKVFYNEILSGSAGSPQFVVVLDVKADRYDNIWALNSFAANQNVVAVYTPQLDWYFFTVPEGILTNVVRSIDFDGFDRVWVGTQHGVSVIDYNNTLADKSDDQVAGNNLTTADGLESNDIKDIAIDQDEIVWIATASGVNYWDPNSAQKVSIQYGLLSNSINKIEVDIRNNKWFGTAAGVSILAADGYTLTHHSTENSPLVSDNVTSFGFDLEKGKVYIGTTNGLSVLETPYARPRENLSQVKAGPNPYVLSQGQEFAISELSDDVAIKFMTENGMIVRHISKDKISGAFTTWDGRDDNGEYVASGIYVYVIYNEETGLNRVGKVAVIR